MPKFIKHVGKHGDRKVAVVFRQIPGEDHMSLIVYTETLGQNIHDPMMRCIESPEAQSEDNLGEALNRAYTIDGKQILQVIHREGMMKKVQTNQIMMTPAPNQNIKLDELNTLLNEMARGEEAIRKLAEIDSSRGLQDPKDVARRVRENTQNKAAKTNQSPVAEDGFLGNTQLATSLRNQAAKMASEAQGLLAESDRLLKQASQLEVPSAPELSVADILEKSAPKKTRTRRKAAVTTE